MSIIDAPVWVGANSSGRSVVSNVGNVVAWFINGHLLSTEWSRSVSLVWSNWASGVVDVWSALTPVVGSVHVVSINSIRLEVGKHFFPSSVLRWDQEVIVILTHASDELLEVLWIVDGTFVVVVGHIVEHLSHVSGVSGSSTDEGDQPTECY